MRLSKRKTDYLLTFFTEFIVLLAGVLVYRFAAELKGHDAFAEYALSRRIVSFIQPVLILGMGVGLPRYISIAIAKKQKQLSDIYFATAFFIVLSFTILLLAILLAFPKLWATIFFGSSEYVLFLPGIAAMLLGLVMHSLMYSYFRGLLKMYIANLFQIINLGIIPILAFLVSDQAIHILVFTGLGWTVVSSIFMIITFAKIKIEKALFIPALKEILFYGIQRVPGDLAIAGLFSIPAFLIAHVSSVSDAGNVAFGISLLNMAGAVFGPICLILLPEASKMIVSGDFKKLFGQIRKITIMTLILTMSGLLLFELLATEILEIYLGKNDAELVLFSRVIMLGSIGYTIYISLRSILDAYYVKAVNTINIVITLVGYLIMAGIILIIKAHTLYFAFAFVLSVMLLGTLTVSEILKIKRRNK